MPHTAKPDNRLARIPTALLPPLLATALPLLALADTPPPTLGTILVTGTPPERTDALGRDQVASVLSQDDIQRHNRANVATALNLLPGVNLQGNMRNEQTLSIRGFDARQMPIYLDGVPVYVPYDGYVDLGRFLTADLAAIQVAKGFSSMSYGPNTLGGAINLVTRRPTGDFEGDFSMGAGDGGRRTSSLNAGSNQGRWYFQAGIAGEEADTFPLSEDFVATAWEDGGDRDNAYYQDRKLSLKVGLTPRGDDEYVLGYYRQDGKKGQPLHVTSMWQRYWTWPYWDKEGFQPMSRTALGDTTTLRARLYTDEYANEINSFTNASFTVASPFIGVGGRSIYQDQAQGGSLEFETRALDDHTLRLSGHLRTDEHRSYNGSSGEFLLDHMKDRLISLSLEDNITLGDSLLLAVGIGEDHLQPGTLVTAANTFALPPDKSARNAQAGLFFDAGEDNRYYATIARKSRLPTLKDRYSQRMGEFIENPGLQAERAFNQEVGYQGIPWQDASLEAAVFYSLVEDRIQAVADVAGILDQMQNVGMVRISGVELALRQKFSEHTSAGGSYTLTETDNLSDPQVRITNIPRHKVTTDLSWSPVQSVELVAFAEYNSARWASGTVELDEFGLANLKAIYRPTPAVDLELGVNNITDQDYSLADGYPSPGRNLFANARYSF